MLNCLLELRPLQIFNKYNFYVSDLRKSIYGIKWNAYLVVTIWALSVQWVKI